MSLSTLISLENDVFRSYAFWGSVLSVKLLSMSTLTSIQRHRTKVVPNPEDLINKDYKIDLNNASVERVRRAHLNDLENILVFFPVGFLYVLTDPEPQTAINLFRAVGIARIVHTLVYAVSPVPQPARGIAYGVAYVCTGYMAFKAIKFFAGCQR